MEVRDAVERDAPAMADLTDAPESVLRNLVHDRTVRVAVEPGADGEGTVLGFVSFDAREGTVHVTEFGGDRETEERLLAEPIRFAEREGLAVELLVRADHDDAMRAAVDARGFVDAGPGPRFRGEPTRRYRLDPVPSDRNSR
ncbi:hypothetical protein JCM30237_19940 [Halolamina litorea]|uniref:N-acetyltransferase domain-containing protein n=1 Tax=Halolamina litorea TaxID=1515593 RepID=A0ABD6BT89_9EURY|nr:hypothetical protein [Halolamina litorea]